MKNEEIKPKHRDKLEALDNLSLGISMIVAIIIGVGVGIGLKELTGYGWTLWLGVFWGIAAAGLNIQKAYKRAQRSLKELEDDPKYQHRAKYGDNTEENNDK